MYSISKTIQTQEEHFCFPPTPDLRPLNSGELMVFIVLYNHFKTQLLPPRPSNLSFPPQNKRKVPGLYSDGGWKGMSSDQRSLWKHKGHICVHRALDSRQRLRAQAGESPGMQLLSTKRLLKHSHPSPPASPATSREASAGLGRGGAHLSPSAVYLLICKITLLYL